jgi:tetratricopeptide (TPR) repeat protein
MGNPTIFMQGKSLDEKARFQFEEAESLGPCLEKANAYISSARHWRESGDLDKATKAYEKAAEIYKIIRIGSFNPVGSLVEGSEGAIQEMAEMLEESGDSKRAAELYDGVATAYYERGNREKHDTYYLVAAGIWAEKAKMPDKARMASKALDDMLRSNPNWSNFP